MKFTLWTRLIIQYDNTLCVCGIHSRVKELTSRMEADTEELTKVQKELEDKSAEVEALKESLKTMSVLEKAQEASGDGKADFFSFCTGYWLV